MNEPEIEQFLNHLAVEKHVAAATQNQALSALIFLYREVLRKEIGWLENLERAKRPQRLPVVLTETEVRQILAQLDGRNWLMASLLYGAGLRLMVRETNDDTMWLNSLYSVQSRTPKRVTGGRLGNLRAP